MQTKGKEKRQNSWKGVGTNPLNPMFKDMKEYFLRGVKAL